MLLFKGLKASGGVQLWGRNNPNPLLVSSFSLLCICLSPFLCVPFPCPAFIFYYCPFGGVWSGFCRSPRVAPPSPLQNSSSSASSEASETCQSVSECSSPTSVSSGSTMGAWASAEKVTRLPPPLPCLLLARNLETNAMPRVAPVGDRGRDEARAFTLERVPGSEAVTLQSSQGQGRGVGNLEV